MANTKITTPDLIDFPAVNNFAGVVLPKGPTSGLAVHYLVVAGGGGGGSNSNSGGGGAGGYRTSYPSGTALTPALGSPISIIVGTGGNGTAGQGGSGSGTGSSGTDSTFGSITSTGGGYGGWNTSNGASGGSGGGRGFQAPGTPGAGNAGGFTPAEGFNGGTSVNSPPNYPAGGGGGASEDGNTNGQSTGGDGAISTIINTSIAASYTVGEIDGTDVYFAGGGGGGVSSGTFNTGGKGGGANGGSATGSAAVNAPANTGGGGGGGEYNHGASEGGSGVIIIRVPSGITASFSGGVTANGSTGGSIAPNTSLGDNIWVVTATTNTNQTVTFSGTVTDGRPSSAVDGEFRYNTTDKKIEYYDGSNWYQLSSSTIIPQPGTTGVCNYPTAATALYQLNGNANDTCGNYNSNAQTAITYSAGKFNEAANFNGSTSVINFAANPLTWGTSDYSISFWFNASAIGSTYTAFISTYVSNGWSIDTGSTTNTIRYYFQNNSGDTNLYSGTFNLNTWNHVAVTMDHSAEAIVYLNNVASNSTGSGLGTVTGSTVMFGDNTSIGNPITGQMDQIRIFPTVLTATQVGYLYTETAP
tara:strand:+ start:119 stop:1873 length:1755 start_codon:yes stop_codon:yes gene_type:complete